MTPLGITVGVIFWSLVWFRMRRRRSGALPPDQGAGTLDGPRWSPFRGGF